MSDPFKMNYLHAASLLRDLEEALMQIGMSGNDSLRRLQSDFIKHGGETYHDIQRRES